MSKLLTVKDVCLTLRVTRNTVLRWVEAGELRAFKLGSGGRLWRVWEQDLQQFLKAQQVKSRI
jgi:excisionase family DNA binding protein